MSAKYTCQVIALVEPSMRAQLDEYAKENHLTLSQAVRRAIVAGLPLLETPAQAEKTLPVAPVVLNLTAPSAYGFGQPEFFTD